MFVLYYFIINPTSKSGLGQSIWKNIQKVLEEKGIPYEHYYTREPYHALKIAQEITSLGTARHIIVVGGDGTLNEVINGIADWHNVTLSYLPAGSGNDFARSMGISTLPYSALTDILNHQNTIMLDQGICHISDPKTSPNSTDQIKYFESGRKFAVSCGIGFDASICYEALHSRLKQYLNRIKLGKLTYLLIALKQVIVYPLTDTKVLINGSIQKEFPKTFFLAAMNQRYEGGGFAMAPQTSPSDGKLSVAVLYNMPKWKALCMMACIMFKIYPKHPCVAFFDCESLELVAARPLIVHTDGEFGGKTSYLKLELAPESINYLK